MKGNNHVTLRSVHVPVNCVHLSRQLFLLPVCLPALCACCSLLSQNLICNVL
jgi:hypothetical protein